MVEAKVQTIFRETEAQTFPWSPPFHQTSNELPEILLLNHLVWGNGLPAGQYEIQQINKSRKKRSWDLYLASIKENIRLKKKIVSQIEKDDIEFLSKDIEKTNQQRLILAKQLLNEQKADYESKLLAKIELLDKKIEDRYNENIRKIRFQRDKEVRRIISMTNKQYNEKFKKKTVIDDFIDDSSDKHAFKMSLGYQRKNKSLVLCEDAYSKTTAEKTVHSKFKPLNRAGRTKKHNCLKEQFVDNRDSDFEEYFQMLHPIKEKDKVVEELKVMDELSYIPDIQDEMGQDKKRAVSVLIHDRNTMFSNSLENPEKNEKMRIKYLRKHQQKCAENYDRDLLNQRTGNLENNLLSKLLDTTSKERQRFEEEKKILWSALAAQAERWRREAAADGFRQKQRMREMVRDRVLGQALQTIGKDLHSQFQNIIRNSLMDSAIILEEDEMRVQTYDIDRDSMPKMDYGYPQEVMVSELKNRVESTAKNHDLTNNHKLQSKLEEVELSVEDMYEDIVSMAVQLDNLITSLSGTEVRGLSFRIVQEKLNDLINDKMYQPKLESIRREVENAHSEYLKTRDHELTIKRVDKLCEDVTEIAGEFCHLVIGGARLETFKEEMELNRDTIVNDELFEYLKREDTFYTFKLMKLSHILGEKNRDNIANNSAHIMNISKKICKNVVETAANLYNFIFEEEPDVYETESLKEESRDDKMGKKICEKLMAKLKMKIKETNNRTEIECKLENKIPKINICDIKKEAAEIIESIVEIWIQIDTMIEQLETQSVENSIKESIANKLTCVLEKLQCQYGNLDEFLGMREIQCIVEPKKCSQETEKILQHLHTFSSYENEEITQQIINTAQLVVSKVDQGDFDFYNLPDIIEPLKTDLSKMVENADNYLTIPYLLKKDKNLALAGTICFEEDKYTESLPNILQNLTELSTSQIQNVVNKIVKSANIIIKNKERGIADAHRLSQTQEPTSDSISITEEEDMESTVLEILNTESDKSIKYIIQDLQTMSTEQIKIFEEKIVTTARKIIEIRNQTAQKKIEENTMLDDLSETLKDLSSQ